MNPSLRLCDPFCDSHTTIKGHPGIDPSYVDKIPVEIHPMLVLQNVIKYNGGMESIINRIESMSNREFEDSRHVLCHGIRMLAEAVASNGMSLRLDDQSPSSVLKYVVNSVVSKINSITSSKISIPLDVKDISTLEDLVEIGIEGRLVLERLSDDYKRSFCVELADAYQRGFDHLTKMKELSVLDNPDSYSDFRDFDDMMDVALVRSFSPCDLPFVNHDDLGRLYCDLGGVIRSGSFHNFGYSNVAECGAHNPFFHRSQKKLLVGESMSMVGSEPNPLVVSEIFDLRRRIVNSLKDYMNAFESPGFSGLLKSVVATVSSSCSMTSDVVVRSLQLRSLLDLLYKDPLPREDRIDFKFFEKENLLIGDSMFNNKSYFVYLDDPDCSTPNRTASYMGVLSGDFGSGVPDIEYVKEHCEFGSNFNNGMDVLRFLTSKSDFFRKMSGGPYYLKFEIPLDDFDLVNDPDSSDDRPSVSF